MDTTAETVLVSSGEEDDISDDEDTEPADKSDTEDQEDNTGDAAILKVDATFDMVKSETDIKFKIEEYMEKIPIATEGSSHLRTSPPVKPRTPSPPPTPR